jgi:Glycosyltransferase WbsX
VVAQRLRSPRGWVSRRRPLAWARSRYETWRGLPTRLSYADFVARKLPRPIADDPAYPCVVHAWDNTPLSGANGVVLRGNTPALFRRLLEGAVRVLLDRPPEQRLLFLKSWNEWAEDNHLEPDLAHGHAWLREIGEALGVAEGREA